MREKEYRYASAAHNGLLFLRGMPGVAFGDRVSIRDQRGQKRNGQVILSSDELVMVQILEGTDDLSLGDTWVRFLEAPFEMPLSPDILGRVFNGIGEPRDDRPPIFSGSGLPHNKLAAQIVRQSKLLGEESRFVVVFAAMGVSYADAQFFREDFESNGVVMFTNLADDPPIERLILPRTAMTAAEYLAFDLDLHVLVVLTDMTYYAEALREVATAKGDVPTRKGYPGYLYSDLAEIYERAGRVRERHGSITMVPVVSMPSDDITHPIPDLTGYITEGQIVLSRELNNQDLYPPVNIPPSLSRLMKDGIGKDDTREDHPRVANQLYAAYAKALEVRNLASIIGPDELPDLDRKYLQFADGFEQCFLAQGMDEDRSIIQTLNIAWELLSLLPGDVLSRVSEADLARYHHWNSSP